jgi:hypothetical protein
VALGYSPSRSKYTRGGRGERGADVVSEIVNGETQPHSVHRYPRESSTACNSQEGVNSATIFGRRLLRPGFPVSKQLLLTYLLTY